MSDPRWLLLIHQLPPEPAYLRVKVARRLAKIGAIQLKQTVYVLPARQLEDFQWLRQEIVKDGGDATVAEARFVDGQTDASLVGQFRAAREVDWRALEAELQAVRDALTSAELERLKRRAAEIESVDFFPGEVSGAVRAQVGALRVDADPGGDELFRRDPRRYRRRTWVTREQMHVDRLASAWLIRRFIDPKGVLKRVPARGYVAKRGEVLFDMFPEHMTTTATSAPGVELFTHKGERCTFEVLLAELGPLRDRALTPIAEVIHDLDLKDARHGRPETAGIGVLIDAICAAHAKDEERLARASALLDDLYDRHRPRRRR